MTVHALAGLPRSGSTLLGNAAQFGPGTNSIANSLQVGTSGSSVHLHAGGAPVTPQNGDIWIANGFAYLRTNGVTGKIQVA